MVNNTRNTSAGVTINGEPLKEVSTFKYLGATLSKDGRFNPEIRTWIPAGTADWKGYGKETSTSIPNSRSTNQGSYPSLSTGVRFGYSLARQEN